MESKNPIVANAMMAKNAEVDGVVLVEFDYPSETGPKHFSKKMSSRELQVFFEKNRIPNYQEVCLCLAAGKPARTINPMTAIVIR